MTKLIFTTWANQPMSNMRASSEAWRCASLVGSSGSFQLFFLKIYFPFYHPTSTRSAWKILQSSILWINKVEILQHQKIRNEKLLQHCDLKISIHFDMLIPRFHLLLWWCCLESLPPSCHPPTTWPFGPPPTRPHWRDVHVNAHVILFLWTRAEGAICPVPADGRNPKVSVTYWLTDPLHV